MIQHLYLIMPGSGVTIKLKIALVINMLMVPVLGILSALFYLQFRSALNQRVLLQLSSIRQLKSVQIEDFLTLEWNTFRESAAAFAGEAQPRRTFSQDITILTRGDEDAIEQQSLLHLLSIDKEGIHDLSAFSKENKMLIGYYLRLDSMRRAVYISPAEKIQQILLERTGMGETGETYLVGPDFKLRSASRFFPDRLPLQITAETSGVIQALRGSEATGIFPDYRNTIVFSAYSQLKAGFVRWAILSEIDQSEALQPLEEMQNRLILIFLAMVGITIIGTFFLAQSLVRPLVDMKARLSEMSRGNFSIESMKSYRKDEIGAMFKALDELVASIRQAMHFANAIGSMQLDTRYEMLSENDSLGQSLINMREKLKDFKDQEAKMQLISQKAILRGQEENRKRLSREMHDGLGPLLTTLRMMIQQLEIPEEQKTKIKEMLDETIAEVRRMTYNLMPHALIDFGVGKALEKLTKISAKVSGIAIRYTHEMKNDSPLPDEINIGLYRIAQEVLNNAIKHSGASEIKMSLTEFDDRISFYFADNGIGFDTTQMYPGAGLINMRERCRILNGNIQVSSSEEGTIIEIEIPLEND
ncbi:MAG: HAMP domain-containing protein [Saprospiraceae bacterium]|nr:HAMP domain-containing protein [Saprospiraceae bacterium]